MSLSIEKLNEIITTSNFEDLIGEVENDWLECKGQPYQLQDDVGKRELAKDVSSFANFQGGYILLGIKTEPSPTHFGDEVKEIRPLEQGLVNPIQYNHVIDCWIYPKLENANTQWIPSKDNNSKGVVIIKIPKQNESLKPFLIVKSLDGKKQFETMFGYVERKRDNSQPFSVVELQTALRSGFNYENQIKERFDRLEALMGSNKKDRLSERMGELEALLRQSTKKSVTKVKKIEPKDTLDKRIEKTLEHDNMNQKRVIIITAYSDQFSELKTIFSTREDSIRRRLEKPPTLRYAGWGLDTLNQARIIRGEMIRVANGDRKVIDLYRDGTLIFSGLADHRFLAWGDSQEKQKLNSVAIIELVYSFINFYKLVLEDFKKKPKDVFIRVDLKNMHLKGTKSYLVPYQIGSFSQEFDDDRKDAPDNDWQITKRFSTKEFDVSVIAFELIKEIYLWFGLEDDKIPYTKTEGELKMVNPEAIKSLK